MLRYHAGILLCAQARIALEPNGNGLPYHLTKLRLLA